MSKRGYIARYSLIVKRLKKHPYSSYEEIRDYIEDQYRYQQLEDESLFVGLSQRTLQRDIRELKNLFGIDVIYSKSEKGYYIQQSEASNFNFQRMIEAFDVFSTLNLSQGMEAFILLDHRKPRGTENLHGLLHAIKNKKQAEFTYQKFDQGEVTHRNLEPYALKEFNSRWYVVGLDTKDGRVKVFALDRMSGLSISAKVFTYPVKTDMSSYFNDCFGIIIPDDADPQEVILSFILPESNYIKSLPLHPSQEVIIDNNEEFRIRLRIHLTYDLRKELLSFGSNVRIIQPQQLADDIKHEHQRCIL